MRNEESIFRFYAAVRHVRDLGKLACVRRRPSRVLGAEVVVWLPTTHCPRPPFFSRP
jgi:hypothetical protein